MHYNYVMKFSSQLPKKTLLSILCLFFITAPPLQANSELRHRSDDVTNDIQRNNVDYSTYILGPGDALEIELLDLPDLSGTFDIGPDGTLYLPRLRSIYAEGLTIAELKIFLSQQYKRFVIDPEIYIRPVLYRAVRVYVGGEVRRPGFYILSRSQGLQRLSASAESKLISNEEFNNDVNSGNDNQGGLLTYGSFMPTLFDAIKKAEGITPFSDLSEITVTRKKTLSSGGGLIQTKLNLLPLLENGDFSHNIRLLDGDSIYVKKSKDVIRGQLLKAGQTNLTPQFMTVYVNGRVKTPGSIVIPQGATLLQAIDLAGGTKVLHGKVEFVRFTIQGEIDRRIFKLKKDVEINEYNNPILMSGDIIRVRDSIASSSVEVLNEITAPAVGLYSLYSIYRGIQ